MKTILSILSFVISLQLFSQNNFIQIEVNKTIGLFNFLETSSGQTGTSSSFRKYIIDSYKSDEKFVKIVNSYSSLNLDYSIKRQEFPDKRSSNTTTKDLLWIAASNSDNINGFSERIIGFLPHQTHTELINLLEEVEVYYDELIWNNEQKNIERIKNQLTIYTPKIEELYFTISKFYNTEWSEKIPFKIILYPIPLKNGHTTAIPKGNALICSFLSHRENDYLSRVGIIIHEMCHILYKSQSSYFQQKINNWFENSDSPYSFLAYSFINEGLATALGNGWAHNQIHNKIDPGNWYNNKYIDGFAHALFPLAEDYLAKGKSIDENFIHTSIELFKQKFPKAIDETAILMNRLHLFANTEKESEANQITNTIHNYFNIRLMNFSSSIISSQSDEALLKKETTKLIIVDSNRQKTIKKLQEIFSQLKTQPALNTIKTFKDYNSKSTIVIINIDNLDKLDNAYKTLSNIQYLESNKDYKII
ncbi:hypothetical protein [Tenacibaculum crassostreae]|uniref:hypothetical protein n=1 Tax=Tenacibaculum crassostreae TaxID=502683 RepID=UPI003892DA37